jgi:hypothetical protein
MCDTAENDKNKLDAVSMKMNKKGKLVAENTGLPIQLLNLILPYLQEATFKADNINLSTNEVNGFEGNLKFRKPNPQIAGSHQVKKGKTLFDKFWLFIVKQSITALFQFIIICFPEFIPQIVFLIFSLVLAVLSW